MNYIQSEYTSLEDINGIAVRITVNYHGRNSSNKLYLFSAHRNNIFASTMMVVQRSV